MQDASAEAIRIKDKIPVAIFLLCSVLFGTNLVLSKHTNKAAVKIPVFVQ